MRRPRRPRQVARRVAAVAPEPPREVTYADLIRRVEHLERALEGLQDSAYRHAQRVDGELAEMRRCIEPSTLARSLSEDARRRGLD